MTRAAESLSLAPSAVSRRLKELETRLGVQLVNRTTRRMSLTEQGLQFQRRCEQILADIEEAEAEVSDQRLGLRGQLRIAAPLSFGLSHLSPLICAFTAQHPELTVDVDLSDRVVDLIGEGFDLALRIGTLRDSTMIARKLCDVRMIACASPDFLARNGEPDRPAALRDLPALCYAGSERHDIWRYGEEDGGEASVQVAMRMRSTNGNLLREAAIAGLGITRLPSFLVHEAIERGCLRPILLATAWTPIAIHVVYPETRHLPAKARAFIDAASARFGPRPDWERAIWG